MVDRNSPSRHIAGALIFFALTALMALLLLVVAFTLWLAHVMGSTIWALLISGGFFLLLAAVVYLFSLHEAFRQLSSRLDTIYEVARITHRLSRILGLWLGS